MTGFLEIALIAFGAQLAVLPGEKVQFIIAGLSTRYNPLLVVAAAGSAFAGWTAVEIAAGEALRRTLSPLVLDLVTAAMFLLFAYLLYRSTPAAEADVEEQATADGGFAGLADAEAGSAADIDVTVLGREVPDRLGGFLPIFAMMAAGEFGDKTQLVTISLAATYGATPAIWTGEMLAVIPVSLANAVFFHTFSHRFDVRKAHFFSAALFGFFAVDTVLGIVTGAVYGDSFTVWETLVGAVAGVLAPVVGAATGLLGVAAPVLAALA